MSASCPQNAVISCPSSKPSSTSNPAWLEALLFNAKLITAGADGLPFPYVKGVFSAVIFLLEAVQVWTELELSLTENGANLVLKTVKQNQENMKELCGDTVNIITVLQDQISAYGDTAALRFLQDVVDTVHQLQMKPQGFGGCCKEVIKASSTTDDINRFRTRIQELRSNFMLMATMDTNVQVQKVLTVISPSMILLCSRAFNLIWISEAVPVAQVPQQINNCPPPSRIFHGRQTIIQQMNQYFTQTTGKQDIFLLHGLGGAGQTQIALKFIAESSYNSSIETIDTGLNIAKTKTVGESSQDALQWLRSKQDNWLLLFDNADVWKPGAPRFEIRDIINFCVMAVTVPRTQLR
ncbi:hypothetical protein C8R44DRAFT_737517 [Mycena epipterygia]|nr:hypothetical protein C8R44DRAFT_737517 [Mycena epipterygia]